jgi:hypothetical protein
MDETKFGDSLDRVRQVAVPPAARALSTLSHIDYEDAFLIDAGPVQDRTAEQWARAIMEDAPLSVRSRLLSGWSMIGLKLVRGRSGGSVLGWNVRASTPEFLLLGVDSRIGMPGELLFKRAGHELLFATFVQQDNLIARGVWTAIEPMHVRVVRDILEQAGRRLRPSRSTPNPARAAQKPVPVAFDEATTKH